MDITANILSKLGWEQGKPRPILVENVEQERIKKGKPWTLATDLKPILFTLSKAVFATGSKSGSSIQC